MKPDRLARLVRDLAAPHVVVIGDYMLDRYVMGDIDRVSPEAPVHVLDVREEEDRAGGAGNVALNLLSLGARVSCVGLRGADAAGTSLARLLRRAGANVEGLVVDRGRRTTLKTRMIAGNQQVLRVDCEDRGEVKGGLIKQLVKHFTAAVRDADAVVVPDYAKGCLPVEVATPVIAACRKRNIPVLVDPHRRGDYSKYKGCTVLKPNLAETAIALGLEPKSDAEVAEAGRVLRKRVQADAVVITRGALGMSVVQKGKSVVHVPGRPRQVYDVTGAGDSVIATLAWGLGGGLELLDVIEIANVTASIVVGKLGSATTDRNELAQFILDVHHASGLKIIPSDEVAAVLEPHRAAGDRIVFTNGCFDLLHVGHIRSLQFAKGHGDILVVGLNTDASVKRLKDPGRPVLAEEDRAHVLGALASVDYVVLFDESTPRKLIRKVRPDVLVKGQDYTKAEVVGADFVESYGGRVVLAPILQGRSTTDILEQIRKSGAP